jgi:hypothetical protein
MFSSQWRKIIAIPFLVIAAVMFWQDISSYLVAKPVHYSQQIGATSIDYTLTDTVMTPGECADLTWNMEGIQAVYLSDAGTVGHGEYTFCSGATTQTIPVKLTVIIQGGEEHIFNEEIQVRTFNPLQPAILLFLIGLLIAAAPTPKFKPSFLYRLRPLLIIPLGFVGACVLLLIADRILTLPVMLDFVTHATKDVLATDPDRCGVNQFGYGNAPFSSHPERTLFKDIPETTAGEGKIIITGVSTANESFLWSELSPYFQNKLLNLSVSAASNLEHGALIDYLQREKQTLTPTKGKSAVLMLYWNGIFAANPNHAGYLKMFVKYDQFNLDTSSPVQWRITPTYNPTSFLQLAYERVTTMLFEGLPGAVEATFQPSIDVVDKGSACYPHDSAHKDQFVWKDSYWKDYYGGEENYVLPNVRTQALETMADYIQATGTPMILVHLPVSHWFRDMVYQDRYLSYMKTFAEKYHVPTYDLSASFSDDDFRDNIHLTITGRRKLQAILFDILVKEGVLSEDELNQ